MDPFFEYNKKMDTASLKAGLTGLSIPDLRYLAVTGSTNDDALAWAEAGAPDGALVFADLQNGGRGRMGRKWVTVAGAALAFSLIFRPTNSEQKNLGLFSPLGALGVATALEAAGLEPQIKWPNDVLLGRRKVCGILAEAVWIGSRLEAVVLGVGVNIAPNAVPPDEEVIFPATCVESVLKKSVDRMALLRAVLQSIEDWRTHLGQQDFLAAWQARLAFRGEQVQVIPPNQPVINGELVGIDENGNLLLQTGAGDMTTIMAGDVHLRLKLE
jgi:BirA family transcriptional regulator, biotin operon repressor / biotin---[acetyl-CoA-carboxylase] ligase